MTAPKRVQTDKSLEKRLVWSICQKPRKMSIGLNKDFGAKLGVVIDDFLLQFHYFLFLITYSLKNGYIL